MFYYGNSWICAIFMPTCTENGFYFLHCDWLDNILSEKNVDPARSIGSIESTPKHLPILYDMKRARTGYIYWIHWIMQGLTGSRGRYRLCKFSEYSQFKIIDSMDPLDLAANSNNWDNWALSVLVPIYPHFTVLLWMHGNNYPLPVWRYFSALL